MSNPELFEKFFPVKEHGNAPALACLVSPENILQLAELLGGTPRTVKKIGGSDIWHSVTWDEGCATVDTYVVATGHGQFLPVEKDFFDERWRKRHLMIVRD